MKRDLRTVAALLVAAGGLFGAISTAPASEPVAAGPSIAAKRCAAGFVHGLINGQHKCLKRGQRCLKRFDRRYHRYKFHCHTGRLTGGPRSRPSHPPPPPPPAVGRVVAEIPVAAGPMDVALGEGSVWVANHNSDTVSRIDPQANRVVATIPVTDSPGGLALGEGAVWVTQHRGTGIARIDPQTNSVVTVIHVGPDACCTPAVGSGSIWTVDGTDRILARIDPATNRVVARIGVGPDEPSGVVFAHGSVWGGGRNDGTIWRVDPLTNQVTSRIPIRLAGPAAPAAAGAGSIWVASAASVARIDPATNQAISISLPVGPVPPDGISVTEAAVWVTGGDGGELWRIDPQTNRVVGKVTLGSSAVGVEVGFGAIWVSDFRAGKIYRVEPLG